MNEAWQGLVAGRKMHHLRLGDLAWPMCPEQSNPHPKPGVHHLLPSQFWQAPFHPVTWNKVSIRTDLAFLRLCSGLSGQIGL